MRHGSIFGFFFLFVVSMGYGQSANFFKYSIAEGLPQSQVFALSKDHNGFLWAGTQGGGLARFDGLKFEVFTTYDGLNSDFITALYASNKDEIYAGTIKGMNRISSNKIEILPFIDKKNHYITSIIFWHDQLLVGCNQGMYVLNKKNYFEKQSNYEQLGALYINDLEIVQGQLWIATNKGLFIQSSPSAKIVKSNKTPFPNIAHIHLDFYGRAWLSIMDYGIICLDIKTKSILKAIDNEILRKPLASFYDKSDILWIASQNNGLIALNTCSDEINIYDENNGVTTNKMRCLLEDDWGNIWLGTSGGGLIKKTNQIFRHQYPASFGFASNRVYALAQQKNGTIMISVGLNDLASFDGTNIEAIPFDSLNVKIRSIACDTAGNTWLATEGNGLLCINGKEKETFSLATNNFPDDNIVQVLTDRQNKLWVATNASGIVSLNGKVAKTYNESDGLPDNYINAIAFDHIKLRLWFGTRKGNAGYINSNGKIVKFTQKNGLSGEAIKTISVDSQGNCFVAIPGDGIYICKINSNPASFERLNLKSKSYATNIYSMIFDYRSNLWIGGENGVHNIIFDEKKNAIDIINYSKGDGFLGLENCHNAVIKDRNNNLWFGTMNGLACYNPNFQSDAKVPPKLFIEEVLLFYKPLQHTKYYASASNSLLLPYNQNHLSFGFRALHTNYPDKIKYRYRLEGADQNWSIWGAQQKVSFANLTPASYNFQIEACIDEKTKSHTLNFPFTIAKPFWDELWFKLVAALLLLFGILSIFKYREKTIKNKAAIKNKELEIQNTLLSLEQKALQLQMNPHFIFNALNSIQSVIVDNNVDKAREEIQNFALLMRSILNNSRKKSVTLKEELVTIEKYLNLEQFCQKNKFTYSIILSPNLDVNEVEIPSMLIQPYIENAVIHGISHLKKSGEIVINFTSENEVLTCEIIDNGVGRQKAKELVLGQQKGHVSLGMEVTGERLKNLGGDIIKDAETIVDLYDDEGQAIGTKVILKIPIFTSY